MKRYTRFAGLFLLLHFAPVAFSQADSPRADKLLFSPGPYTCSWGSRESRFAGVYSNGIVGQDVDHLVEPFRHRNETHRWQSEFWGKWITSAISAQRYAPSPALSSLLREAVDKLIATQTPDGYIGNYAPDHRLEQWDIWGRKYCMLGLLDYYELSGYAPALQAAKKLADHLMAELAAVGGSIVIRGNYRGMAASSVLEPVCQLYRLTGEPRYLAFAEEIVRQWDTDQGPGLIRKSNVNVGQRFPAPKEWYSWEQGQKAYEMMSCYEGLLELYRLTGKTAYRDAVITAWQNIYDTEINVAGSGAAAEMWFGGKALQALPIRHYQETCVTVTWLKLSHQLLRLTGDARYADAAEQTFYNALLGAVSPDGLHWAKYTPLTGQRLPGSGQCGMHLNCCDASGPRGLFNFPRHIVMRSGEGASINYFVAGTYSLSTPSGKELVIRQETSYPETETADILVEPSAAETFTVALRIPAWSKRHEVTVNGEPYPTVPGEYLFITRPWKKGDRIHIGFDMRGRLLSQGETPAFHTILRGPVLLALDSRQAHYDVAKAFTPVRSEPGYIELEVADRTEQGSGFKAKFIPESFTEEGAGPVKLMFCDYASAGYAPDKPVYRVWIPQLYSRH